MIIIIWINLIILAQAIFCLVFCVWGHTKGTTVLMDRYFTLQNSQPREKCIVSCFRPCQDYFHASRYFCDASALRLWLQAYAPSVFFLLLLPLLSTRWDYPYHHSLYLWEVFIFLFVDYIECLDTGGHSWFHESQQIMMCININTCALYVNDPVYEEE